MAHNITSRRLRLIASTLVVTSLALGLGACGKPQTNSNSAATSIAAHSPAKIRLGAAPSGNKMAAETSAMSSDVMRAMPVTYVYSGPATDLTAPATAWQFPAGNKPTAAQVAALAKALGITGDVHSVPGDTSGSLMVGSDDYTKPSLTVSADAMGSWWYNPGTIATTFPDMPTCVPPDAGVAGVPDSTTASSAAADTAISPIPEAVPMPCGPEPTPPANVPTADQAKTKALELFKQLGLDVSSYRVDATADQWGANVTAALLLDGVAAPLSWGIGFGAEGAITWASGFSATPERADLYPRISINAAVARLQAGHGCVDADAWVEVGAFGRCREPAGPGDCPFRTEADAPRQRRGHTVEQQGGGHVGTPLVGRRVNAVRRHIEPELLEQLQGLGLGLVGRGHIGGRRGFWPARHGYRFGNRGNRRVCGRTGRSGRIGNAGHTSVGRHARRHIWEGGGDGARVVPPRAHGVGTHGERGLGVIVGAHHERTRRIARHRMHIAGDAQRLRQCGDLRSRGLVPGRELPGRRRGGEVGGGPAVHVGHRHRPHHITGHGRGFCGHLVTARCRTQADLRR
ncbi:MAG: hypothetical protein WCO88_07955 [Actinomycetota bacterium]